MEFERIGDHTVYLGDCVEHMIGLKDGAYDLLCTDPPYGIRRDRKASQRGRGYGTHYPSKAWDSDRPDAVTFRTMMTVCRDHCIWGANYFAEYLPPRMRWLVWDKGQNIANSDCELAYTSQQKALRRLILNRAAIRKDGPCHPSQKPVKLMTWCLGFFPDAVTVFDPFAGSGSTGVACVQTGKKFIGVERDREYFDIMCRRIEAAIGGNL